MAADYCTCEPDALSPNDGIDRLCPFHGVSGKAKLWQLREHCREQIKMLDKLIEMETKK